MPTQRTRFRQVNSISGLIRDANGVVISTGNVVDEYRQTIDFWQKKARKTPDALRGTLEPTNFTSVTYFQRPLRAWRRNAAINFDYYPASALFVHDSAISLYHPGRSVSQDNDFYTLRLLERTNPFRSEFSVPVFIKELVDIGTMFKLAARTFAGFVGGAFLNYKFGWVAFLADLRTLFSITKALERRIKELTSLQKHGGLRRRVYLGGHGGTLTANNVLMNSTWGWFPRVNLAHSARVEVYGSVRWIPTRDFREDIRKLGVVNLAFRKVFDLEEPDPQTVWEMIPFSWLADYFTSIGSYLRANNGAAKVQPWDICLVRKYSCDTHGTLVGEDPSLTNQSRSCSGNAQVVVRTVIGSPPSFPNIYWELLTYSQWQVVVALLLKFKG